MGAWVLTDLQTGDVNQVDDDMIERLVGVEISYIRWAIEQDGYFENDRWRVSPLQVT